MARLRVETVHGPARREVLKGLVAYNNSAVGKPDYHRLTITLRERNKIVGGLAAETYFGWMFINLLWVSEEQRGKALGRSLMAKAEAEARRLGARRAYVNTFSFQAPGFYKKLGYREFGRLKDFPPGHSHIWLAKPLSPARGSG